MGLGVDYSSFKTYGTEQSQDAKNAYSNIQSLANTTAIPNRSGKTYATSSNKTMADYGTYERPEYGGSEKANQWWDKYNSLQKPGEFQYSMQQNWDDVINKALNREKFSYDLNGDALYQQYKDQYMLGGQMAMQDTIGQAAAMTGGYGNSYAQGVGQQAYQGYLQQLNDKIPELYQLALDQYNREGDELYRQYELLSDRQKTEYGMHRDTVSDYNTDRGLYLDQYNTEENRALDSYWKGTEMDYNIHTNDRNFEHTLERESVQDSKDQQSFEETQHQFDVKSGLERDKLSLDANSTLLDYELKVDEVNKNFELEARKILEDERNGVISRDVAEREIKALEEESAAKIAQIKAETEPVEPQEGEEEDKGWDDYSEEEHNKNVKANGGSYYEKTLSTLKAWKKVKKPNDVVNKYLEELVGNSYLSRSEYMTLYNKYRDDRL